ncbi:hypothetical protein F5Y06DRAFT_90602 [Hypoxylon sp. FL0890]|nr:hypothetical protein F5Y06DRAFT_90602 [Hypoxylon sp. FL0890]
MVKMLLPILFIAFLASLASVKGVSAPMNTGCSFHLTTSGGFNGSVGQLADGQVRAGSDLTPSLFTWFGDAFADQQGRSCWWTPPTSVLQCDRNQEPSHGFEIGCYGGVSYRDQSSFYECQTGVGDEVNLYLLPKGVNCSPIMLHADGCRPPCAGESSSSSRSTGTTSPSPNPIPTPFQVSTTSVEQSTPQVVTSTTSSPETEFTSASIPGQCDVAVAESPDEIILIDKGNPDMPYGPNPTMFVQLTPNSSAIFVFRLAPSDAGKECTLAFNLPSVTPQQPSWYKLTGTGQVSFALLDMPPANPGNTSYSNAPGVALPLEAVVLTPGLSVKPLTFPCPTADAEFAVIMRDEPSSDTNLWYHQLEPEVPLGLYLVIC